MKQISHILLLCLITISSCSDKDDNNYEKYEILKFPFEVCDVSIQVEDKYENIIKTEQFISDLKIYRYDTKSYVTLKDDGAGVTFKLDEDKNAKKTIIDADETERNRFFIGICETLCKTKINIGNSSFYINFILWRNIPGEGVIGDYQVWVRKIVYNEEVLEDSLEVADTPTITFVYENGTYKLKK